MLKNSPLILAISAALIFFISPSVAQADPVTCPPPGVTDPATGECFLGVVVPGDPGGGGGGGGGSGGGAAQPIGSGTPEPCVGYQGEMVPCRDGNAYWSNQKGCYISPYPGGANAFSPNDPIWQGNYPNGTIYICVIPGQLGLQQAFWAAAPPAGPAAPPDPAVLAQQALESMKLRAVQIGIVPENIPGSVGIIGFPTWMWAADPGESTTGPITRTASAAGYTVTATATLGRIVWDMGDGTSVTCQGAGTAYQDSYGRQSSPTCGHTYTRTGTYPVSATSYWDVAWEGIGQTGVIPLDVADATQITMGEVQVLSQ